MWGNYELLILFFLFECLSFALGFFILTLLAGMKLPRKVDRFIERHDGKILLLLILGYNLWKSIFIVNYLLEWYLS